MKPSLVMPFLICSSFASTPASKKSSVLLIIVDDMRSLQGLPIRLPNYEKLARIGFEFENAFAQQSLCAPSRNSFLTGRRPDTIRLYDFYSYWRDVVGNFTTLPQFFKENGYRTFSFGKVFHPGKSSNFTDDHPYSWSNLPYHPSTERYKEAKMCRNYDDGHLARNLICPVNVEFQPEKTLPDIQIAESVVEKLKEMKHSQSEMPFFMAVGFHKPHIPLKFPRKYLDFYPISQVPLAKYAFKPPSMPNVAWNPWLDVKERDDIKKLNISFPFGEMPKEWALKIRQSYFAALMYIDDLIGSILNNVDLNNTIVALTSDHGWSLGEHGEWAKYSNFDVALKVPLIIYDPNLQNQGKTPIKTKLTVELLDLFPTLVELSGISQTIPMCEDKTTILCAEGKSLVGLMKKLIHHDKNISWNNFAYSQYPRPSSYPTMKPNSDKPKLKEINIMGYSIRTDRFRYTEWIDFNHSTFSPYWEKAVAKELYDHSIDSGENLNLADRLQLKYIIEKLAYLLRIKNG